MNMLRIDTLVPRTPLRLLVLAVALCLPALTALQLLSTPAAAASGTGAEKKASQKAADQKIEPIDINTADFDALVDLPGIGKVVAQRIIDYRKEHGPFKKVEELVNVKGIGERLLERVRDRVMVASKN
jgi:competence protein ComEA